METILRRELIHSKEVSRLIGITFFVLATCFGAFVRIPLPGTPVPFTLQTFFVLLSGAVLKAYYGSLTQFIYCFLGVIGLPVFSNAGAGFLYLLGPTGGYLLGFILAAFLVGRGIKSTKTTKEIFFIMVLADLLILTLGTLWLWSFFKLPIGKAMISGFLIFLPSDIIKAACASIVYQRIRKRTDKIFN
ncbi:MAG: biotin transporter BioY [Candidatus Omnitrophica bacterium]|nr:biotin transporter BioY [Candidatus Omnitrophota bacterium]